MNGDDKLTVWANLFEKLPQKWSILLLAKIKKGIEPKERGKGKVEEGIWPYFRANKFGGP